MTTWNLTLLILALTGAPASDDPAGHFEARIRPVLVESCLRCHGARKASGGLRLDSRAALLEGGDSGPAVVPGKPDESLLLQAVRRTHDTLRMPPNAPLPMHVVADIADWIEAGAPWPEGVASMPSERPHWSFEPMRDPAPPAIEGEWGGHPIDRFIAAGWARHGLDPVGLADRRTLLRRITFGLIGLPPTADEMAAFLADESPAAWERVVDRLLASPHYGERWGRHWMDVARYADTAGDNADYPVPEVRLYRDYIIDAFNADKPYDEFVREQLAGDILAREGPESAYTDRVVATCFLALSRRYGTGPFELWHLTLEDAIETTGRAFLGLTLRCARCHDHKFDPIPTRDYYALYGVFASTRFPWAGAEEFASKQLPRQGFQPLEPADRVEPRLQAYRQRLAGLESELARLQELARSGQDEPTTRMLRAQIDRLTAELRSLSKPGLPDSVPGAYAVGEGAPTSVPIQRGGDPAQPGEVVPRGVPGFLAAAPPPAIPDDSSGRRELADWLTRPDHPLTARVMVNRIWQHHFGRGLVATPSNFGVQGAPPSHPELLDWLARRFVESGWSIKAMHRLILTSRVYQLSSQDHSANQAIDPDNQYLWRHERRRLDAEALRDAMLAASGRLDRRRPAAHPFPPMREWAWTQHNAFKAAYPSKHRTVYLMTQRLIRHPYLALFDGPDTNSSIDVRTRSTVPLQALFLMNSPFTSEQARAVADLACAAEPEPRRRIRWLHERLWSRPPEEDEVEHLLAGVGRLAQAAERAGAAAEEAQAQAWAALARVMLSANEFLYLD